MKLLFPIIILLTIITPVIAVPTMLPATEIGNNNFTFTAADYDANGIWFKYGIIPESLVVWTPVVSNGTWTERGAPIEPSMTYYATACDVTGCGNIITFTTLPFTPLPESTLGNTITNLTRNKFNPILLPGSILTPYTWLFPQGQAATAIAIVCGMMFFFIYLGLWYRQRGVGGAVIIGLLTSSTIMFSNKGLNLGIPLEFQAIAQALLYASLAGVFLTLLKR